MKDSKNNESFLTDEEIIEIIEKYINRDETNYAILIDGEWGSGKTYFIREKLMPILKEKYEEEKNENEKCEIKDYNLKNKSPIYISLYGIEDTNEIAKNIYINLIGEKYSKFINFSTNIIKIFKTDLELSKITDALQEIDLLKNRVIIFDDLERCNININTCLGYINNLVEHNNIKVIIVANEKEIGKLNYDDNFELKLISAMNKDVNYNDPEIKDLFGNRKETENDINTIIKRTHRIFKSGELYKIIKEKLIGKTIYYKPSVTSIFDSLVDRSNLDKDVEKLLKDNKQQIIERLEYNDCTNIRTIKFIIEVINEIGMVINKIDIQENDKKTINAKLLTYIIDDSVMFKTTGKVYNWNKNVEFDTIILRDDEYASILDFIVGFKFVDIYIKQGSIDRKHIEKTIKNYLEYEINQISDVNDPFYKLSVYWELEEKEIIECLDLIEEKLKKGEYSFKLFPQIIKTLSSIQSMNFQVDKIKTLVNIMKEKISEEKVQYIDWDVMIKNSNVVEIYNENIEELRNVMSQKAKKEKEQKINEIINGSDWGIKINEYCYEKNDEFLNDGMFLAKFDIEKIIDNIKNSNSKNICYFKYCIDRVYHFSNLKDFYEKDIPNLQKLIKELEKINKDNYGFTKKMAIGQLIEITGEKLRILSEEKI